MMGDRQDEINKRKTAAMDETKTEHATSKTPQSSGDGLERRRYRRIFTELGMTVSLPEAKSGKPGATETTKTVNVSPGDAFFLSGLHERLRIGSELLLSIELPTGSKNLFSGRRLEVKGRVVRLGEAPADDPDRRGVAVRFLKTPRFISDLE
jgi:hypothetical protein